MFTFLALVNLYSQKVVISDDATYTGNISALLDVHSKNGNLGILIPQVTLTSKTDNSTISSPANGLLVFHTGGNGLQEGFYYWSASDSEWKLLYSGNVPNIPGNVVFWIRPTGKHYIQPEYNPQAKVFDAGQNYTFFYDGTNKHGAFFAGDDVGVIGQRAGVDTNKVPAFIADDYPFDDVNADGRITSDDNVTYSGIYAYGEEYVGITGIAALDAGVRGIGIAGVDTGTNANWPVVGVMGEVIGDGNTVYGQQGVYGWQAAPAGSGDYCQGVTGRTSQTGSQSAGVGGYYTSSVGNLTTCYSSPVVFGLLGYGQGVGVYGYAYSTSYWAGYFDGDLNVNGDVYANSYNKSFSMFYTKATLNTIEDFGSGKLKNGTAKISIKHDLVKLMDKGQDYRVYIQLTSDNPNGVYVKKHHDYFEVIENNNGKSNSSFDWRLVIVKESDKAHKKQIQNEFRQKGKTSVLNKLE